MMCDCHPLSKEDAAIWRKHVKDSPRTKEQWMALHSMIEDYRRLLIDDFKRKAQVGTD